MNWRGQLLQLQVRNWSFTLEESLPQCVLHADSERRIIRFDEAIEETQYIVVGDYLCWRLPPFNCSEDMKNQGGVKG